MASYQLILIGSAAFGLGGILLGFVLGVTRGAERRNRMQLLESFPLLSMRETLN